MKFLLLLVLALIVMWLWRSNRQNNAAPGKNSPPSSPQEMVSCQLCAMHIPKAEAVAGTKGLYCCAEHRQRMES